MRTIAIVNHKGGSAKTTTTVNLGAALAARGQRVLVIDLDPLGSASAWLGVPAAPFDVTRAIRGEAELTELVHETTAPGVQLVPASPSIIIDASQGETAVALGFMRAMERLPALWDLVLIDCAPTLRYLSVAPLVIAQGILIPVEAHVLDLGGLASIMIMTERIRGGLNATLQIDGILVCRSNRTTHSRQVVERIEATYPGLTFRTQIRESTRLAEAPGFQLPISRYAPGCTGDDDYRLAADELLERLAAPVVAPEVRRRSRSVRSRVAEKLGSRPPVRGRTTSASPADPSLGSADHAD